MYYRLTDKCVACDILTRYYFHMLLQTGHGFPRKKSIEEIGDKTLMRLTSFEIYDNKNHTPRKSYSVYEAREALKKGKEVYAIGRYYGKTNGLKYHSSNETLPAIRTPYTAYGPYAQDKDARVLEIKKTGNCRLDLVIKGGVFSQDVTVTVVVLHHAY